MTAIANDYSYEVILARQVTAFCRFRATLSSAFDSDAGAMRAGARGGARDRRRGDRAGGRDGGEMGAIAASTFFGSRRRPSDPGGRPPLATRCAKSSNGPWPTMNGVWAAFLDRDGTINHKPAVGGYVLAPGQLRLLPGAGIAIRRLNQAGWRVVVVTNQRGIARALISEDDLRRVHEHLLELLGMRSNGRRHLSLPACNWRMRLPQAGRWPAREGAKGRP